MLWIGIIIGLIVIVIVCVVFVPGNAATQASTDKVKEALALLDEAAREKRDQVEERAEQLGEVNEAPDDSSPEDKIREAQTLLIDAAKEKRTELEKILTDKYPSLKGSGTETAEQTNDNTHNAERAKE